MSTEVDEMEEPLLSHSDSSKDETDESDNLNLRRKIFVESKKLWGIVGPAIFVRISTYSMTVITQAFAGHLGETELAAISIVTNVIVGLVFGLLLGMASALETLCGQAFGANRYHMLGIYMQRSCIVLTLCSILLLPFYGFTSSILKLLGQPSNVAELSGSVALWMIPLHFSFAFQFSLQRFLQSQLKNFVIAWTALFALIVHLFISWLFVYGLKLGLVGTVVTLNFSWWILVVCLFCYTVCGGCPLTWQGFSLEAFSGLWEYFKLSASSGVMLGLENWYYRILILMAGSLANAEIEVDALSICIIINGWEMMIPLAFFAATGSLRNNFCVFLIHVYGCMHLTPYPSQTEASKAMRVRVANELGSGNGEGARFASVVSITTSTIVGCFFCFLILILHNQIGLVFTSSKDVIDEINNLIFLLAASILLNSIQPVLSGIAVGSGWQSYVAYINIACYYVVGLPLGLAMEWVFHQSVMGIWAGMIFGGTALQTVILGIITMRCDWDKEAERASKHAKE